MTDIPFQDQNIQAVTNAQKAKILHDALPYIRGYNGKIVVVKYGGNAMVNDAFKKSVLGDIVLLHLVGMKVVLVHGGGPFIKKGLAQAGIETKFIDGLRVTDEETMKIVQMVLDGQVNKDLVNILGALGGKAIGLSGIDDLMIRAKKKSDELGLVGDITDINPRIIFDMVNKGYIPVISSIGTDGKGHSYNINADTAAAKVAAALQAECMITMTDIDGVLKNPDDPLTLYHSLTMSQVEELKREQIISGGMIPKVQCCVDAIEDGVKRVFIINGTVPHAIIVELLTSEGLGTMFVR